VQPAEASPSVAKLFAAIVAFGRRHERSTLLVAAGLLAALAVLTYAILFPRPRALTQKDIDSAVHYTLNNLPQAPSRDSVVRVRQLPRDPSNNTEIAVGSGVVIVDSGLILTALHVVAGAERVGVVFANGLESDADIVSEQPENDLAVLQAKTLPDDLKPATLESTAGLDVGDRVIAVGFPFGIGPSVTAGVISGFKREYFSPEGNHLLTDLIQFDAAVNPGNSGGPLVTEDGQVVGIVTAILNPTSERVFIGIGFAVPIETAAGGIGLSPF